MNAWTDTRSHSRRQHRANRPLTVEFFLGLALLTIAFTFGGASRLHATPLAIVEIASVPVLLISIWKLITTGSRAQDTAAFVLLAAVIALPLLQLIPLPYTLWTSLPGRDGAASAAALAGLGRLSEPLSLSPQDTWHSALALLPPAAMFLVTLHLSSHERRLMIGAALIAVIANFGFGLAQAIDSDSPLYLYSVTNHGSAAGLFSNRNHYAILLVTALPMTALLLMYSRIKGPLKHIIAVAFLIILPLIVIGVIMGRSRAAVGLLAPSAIITGMMLLRSQMVSKRVFWSLVGILAVGLIAALIAGGRELMQRWVSDMSADIRFAAAPEILHQGLAHLPFGTGIGSFESVFQSFEPLRLIRHEFLNHAHDDYLEVLLDGGLPAILLLAAFLIWWTRKVTAAAKSSGPYSDLAWVGGAITGLLLLHSVVDYPLRTPALATFFALGAALLIVPKDVTTRRRKLSADMPQ